MRPLGGWRSRIKALMKPVVLELMLREGVVQSLMQVKGYPNALPPPYNLSFSLSAFGLNLT
ncbi:MAG: hypothetical protein QXI18_03400 [Nitrososphaerota archaeon]